MTNLIEKQITKYNSKFPTTKNHQIKKIEQANSKYKQNQRVEM